MNQQLFTQPYAQMQQMQSPFAAQTPYQQGYVAPHLQGQIGQQLLAAAPVVSEVTLRVVSAALTTIIEQVRTDQQALQMLCAQGQLTPQAHSNVLVESARRAAPVIAAAFGAIVPGLGQQIAASAHGNQPYAQQQPFNQQYAQQQPFNQQHQFNQQPLINQQYGWQTPYGQQFGPTPQSPFNLI